MDASINALGATAELPVLLFFQDYEADRFVKFDRYLQRLVRPVYRRLGGRERASGFKMWFAMLVTALERAGHTVAVNDHRLARKYPDRPVGLVGYPCLLDGWTLPNPTILGPALLNHPSEAQRLTEDPRNRTYLVTCQWMYDVFAAAYGSSNVALWHGGFDMDEWPTTASSDREIDVLVYDKVRWNRENVVPALTAPFQRIVEELGLRTEVVTYGAYERERYLELLQRSRSMLFLCEHETQGMAYQEAMASGVAVLAWDNGFWLDPRSSSVSDTPIPASSVPYFSQTCGARFSAPSELDTTFREFWNHIDDFAPRDFVAEHLSMAQSADIFMNLYDALR